MVRRFCVHVLSISFIPRFEPVAGRGTLDSKAFHDFLRCQLVAADLVANLLYQRLTGTAAEVMVILAGTTRSSGANMHLLRREWIIDIKAAPESRQTDMLMQLVESIDHGRLEVLLANASITV